MRATSLPNEGLRTFIEHVIVPALLDRFLEERERMARVDYASPPPPRVQSQPTA